LTIHVYVSGGGALRPDRNKLIMDVQERECREVAGGPVKVWRELIMGLPPLREREKGRQMVAALSAGDTVIATKFDRLFRTLVDAAEMTAVWRAQGVELIMLDISPSPIMTDPGVPMFFALLGALAAGEGGRLRERAREGRIAKELRGGAVKRPRYGYRIVGVGRDARQVVDENEMKMRRLIREAAAAGLKPNRIANAMAKQVQPDGSIGWKNRVGKPLMARQIRRILSYKEDPAELVARGKKKPIGLPPPPPEPSKVPGYTPPSPPVPSPVDIAIEALRSRYDGDEIILAALTAKDASAYQRARAAVVEAYGEDRLVELRREIKERVAEAQKESSP
jgi:DNA invertase Pin-like site-specific DNA recombinase